MRTSVPILISSCGPRLKLYALINCMHKAAIVNSILI